LAAKENRNLADRSAFPLSASYFAMLKLLSRQAVKTLRDPLRRLLPNPPYSLLQTRHLYTERVPFSTLARRFSASSPSPICFFREKAEEEAIQRGQFVDIHDISGVNPDDYDALITDIDNETLQSEISEVIGIPYLQEAMKDEAEKVAGQIRGFVYSCMFRMILPCVLSTNDTKACTKNCF
jgi:hypothetical protein